MTSPIPGSNRAPKFPKQPGRPGYVTQPVEPNPGLGGGRNKRPKLPSTPVGARPIYTPVNKSKMVNKVYKTY